VGVENFYVLYITEIDRNIFELTLKLLKLYAAEVNWKQKSEN